MSEQPGNERLTGDGVISREAMSSESDQPNGRERESSHGAIAARADVQCCRVTAVGMVANASHPTERGGDGQGGSPSGKPDGDLISVKTVKAGGLNRVHERWKRFHLTPPSGPAYGG